MKRPATWSLLTGLAVAWLALIVCSSSAYSSQPATDERMLTHDVYFALKDNSSRAKAKLIADCKKYLAGHPGTVSFSVGPLAPELNRDVNDRDFDVALHIVFKNKAAHDQYQKSEKHRRLIAENKENLKKVRVFDSYVDSSDGSAMQSPEGSLAAAIVAAVSVSARAKVNAAKVQIALLEPALDAYNLDLNTYPSTAQGLQALLAAPKDLAAPAKWSGPYIPGKQPPLDPWQRPYRYQCPGKRAGTDYDLWSAGPDGVDGTEDDIGNWAKK
jgi:type II secretion system protein G